MKATACRATTRVVAAHRRTATRAVAGTGRADGPLRRTGHARRSRQRARAAATQRAADLLAFDNGSCGRQLLDAGRTAWMLNGGPVGAGRAGGSNRGPAARRGSTRSSSRTARGRWSCWPTRSAGGHQRRRRPIRRVTPATSDMRVNRGPCILSSRTIGSSARRSSSIFEQAGYRVAVGARWCEGCLTRAQSGCRGVILDWMLPCGDVGLEVCRAAAPIAVDAPILDADGADDRGRSRRGFERGADDDVAKPFSPREVVGPRAGAAAARAGGASRDSRREDRQLEVDHLKREVRVGGRAGALTPTELKLIEALARAVVGRSPARSWSRAPSGPTTTASSHGRHAHDEPAPKARTRRRAAHAVATVHGVGYGSADDDAG